MEPRASRSASDCPSSNSNIRTKSLAIFDNVEDLANPWMIYAGERLRFAPQAVPGTFCFRLPREWP